MKTFEDCAKLLQEYFGHGSSLILKVLATTNLHYKTDVEIVYFWENVEFDHQVGLTILFPDSSNLDDIYNWILREGEEIRRNRSAYYQNQKK